MKSFTEEYYLKQKILQVTNNFLNLRINAFEGIFMGIWNGVFFGIIWTMTMNFFQIKYAKIIVSFFAPFMMWFYVDLNANSITDLQNSIFILISSSISAVVAIISSSIVHSTHVRKINAIDTVSGLGIGVLVGLANTYILLSRGL